MAGLWYMIGLRLSFVRSRQITFQSGRLILHSHQQCTKSSWSSIASPAFSVSVLDFSHSHRCIVVPHCDLNLQFPNDIRCGTSFHVLICICRSSLVSYLSRAFAQFFNWVVYLLLNFKSALYILDAGLLSDSFCCCFVLGFFLQIFSPRLWLGFLLF